MLPQKREDLADAFVDVNAQGEVGEVRYLNNEPSGPAGLEREVRSAVQRRFTVGEVPIIFVDRRLGQSKISRGEIFKAGRTVLRLALRRLWRKARRSRAILASTGR